MDSSKEIDGVVISFIDIETIQKSKEKGIHLTFILTPRSINKELLTLSSKIPITNIVDMGNPIKFESLYKIENSFDVAHLNTKGSEEYTRLLAIEFLKVNSRTQNITCE